MTLPVNSDGSLPPTFNPLDRLKHALGSGVAVWEKISHTEKENLPSLISLIFIIEAHIESLTELCMLKGISDHIQCDILNRLLNFYQQTKYPTSPSKRGLSLQQVIQNSASSSGSHPSTNYYESLSQLVPDDNDSFYPSTIMTVASSSQDGKPVATPTLSVKAKNVSAVFSEDLGISAVSTFMNRNQQEYSSEMEDDDEQHQLSQENHSSTTTIVAPDRSTFRYRLNLIRHKNATSTDLTTLQLFKTFLTNAKKTDKSLVVLPVDSTKQHLTPLTSQKQIENLSPNQLRLYFSSWFKDQHHSISGFVHLYTVLTVEELQTELPLAEWLQTFQYSIALCKSQTEEMSIIGALCYGSLFLHRDSLLQGIQAHPKWVELNSNKEKPIIIDLIIKPFRSPGKSEDMIFVRAERSKKEEVRKFFLDLYDGTPKKYPRGDMLLFIPVTSKLESDYTDNQRTKYLFNHTTYLGDQDCIAIFGLNNLTNEVTLKDGSIITVRTLLKSLPASPGMSRNRLFQVVDPAANQDCVIATFQRCDKSFIEDRKFLLATEILSYLAPGQASVVFVDELESVSFVDAHHKNKGKVVRVHFPTQTHQEFVKHADSILSSPPKKRSHTAVDQPQPSVPLRSIQLNNVTYSGAVQAQTTRTRSVVQPDGTCTTTTTQMSQTVMSVLDTRFKVIEEEQSYLKQRITGVENKATNIDGNIQAIMKHLQITPVNYKRKPEGDLEEESVMEYANHSITNLQGQGATRF